MGTKHDLAASISLDTKPLAVGATEVRRELGLIDRAAEATTHHGEQLARVLGTVASVATKAHVAHAAIRGDVFGASRAALIDRAIPDPASSARPVDPPAMASAPTHVEAVDTGGISTTALHMGVLAAKSTAARAAIGAVATEVSSSGLAAGLAAVGTQGLWLAGGVAAAGLALAGLVVAVPSLIAFGEIADRQFDKFHGTINNITTGAPLATAELGKLTAAAQEFSLESSRSFTELATLAGHVTETRKGLVTNSATTAVAGTTATDLAAASLPIVSNFEKITGLQTGEAAKAQAALVAGFQRQGMSLEESIAWQQQLNDLIAVGANISGLGTDQLAKSLSEVAPEAQAVGWGIRETSTAVTALAESGMSAAQIDKTLGPALTELRVAGVANRDAFAEMGISITDAEGRLQPVASIAGSVSVAMSDLTEAQRAAELRQIGMSDETAKLVAKLSTLGPALNEARDRLRDAGGASGKLVDSLTHDYDAAWKKNTSSINSLTLSFGGLFTRAKEAALTPVLEASGAAMTGLATVVDYGAKGIHSAADFASSGWQSLKDIVATPWKQPSPPIVDLPPPPPPPPKLDLPEWMTKAGEIGETATKVGDLTKKQAELDSLYEQGSYTTQEYANASRNIAAALDAARGGGEARIASLTREIELAKLATEADRERQKLVLSGMAPDTANAVVAKQAELAVEKELTSLRERQRLVGKTESEQREQKLIDSGATQSQARAVASEAASLSFQEQYTALQREIVALGQTEVEQRQQKAIDQGMTVDQSAMLEVARQEREEKERIRDLQAEIAKLAGTPVAEKATSSEIAALETERDLLKQQQDDQKRAQQLAEQYDPTIRIKQQREELDRLRESIGEVAYANGVAALDEQWQNATKSSREHRNEINKGLTGTAATDAIFKRIAMGDNVLNGLPGGKPSPLAKGGLLVPPAPPVVAPPMMAMPRPQLEQRPDPALQVIADRLAEILTKLDSMARSESDTASNTSVIAENLEVR